MSNLESFDENKKKCQFCGKYSDKEQFKNSVFSSVSIGIKICPSCWKKENDMLDNIVGNDDDFFNEYEYE